MGRLRVAVVGATGAVGQDLRGLLETREFPCDEAVMIASERSAGTALMFRGRSHTVRALSEDGVFDGVDVALFSAGAARSREHAPRAVQAGALVVDNSSGWRMDPDVPLVVAEVNPEHLDGIRKGIVANPNCTTMIMMLPLKALHDAFGLRALVATSFQAASGAGQRGIAELEAQVEPLFARRELLRRDGAAAAKLTEHTVHAQTLAFNVVPLVGHADEAGYTDEELKLRNESRKILGLPDLAVSPTCVRVPVMAGHAIAMRAMFTRRVSADAAVAAMAGCRGLLLDDAPTPLEWAGRDEVAVGRVRADFDDPYALNLWVTGDNLRKGAALNAVQLAELLLER